MSIGVYMYDYFFLMFVVMMVNYFYKGRHYQCGFWLSVFLKMAS